MAGRDPVGDHEEAGQKVKKRFAIARELIRELRVIFLEGRGAAGEFIYRD
jgi:hypothetical protein